jgi:hypothetical protein
LLGETPQVAPALRFPPPASGRAIERLATFAKVAGFNLTVA